MPVQPLQGQWAPARADASWHAARFRRPLDGSCLRGVAALFFCVVAGGATAQVSGTASGVSDYRYRGNTFSDRQPAAQGGVTYDDRRAGTPASSARRSGSSRRPARPPISSRSSSPAMRSACRRASAWRPAEIIPHSTAPMTSTTESSISASPTTASTRGSTIPRQYFGQSSNAVYGEINAAQPLVDRVRLTLHAGCLRYRYESVVPRRICVGNPAERRRRPDRACVSISMRCSWRSHGPASAITPLHISSPEAAVPMAWSRRCRFRSEAATGCANAVNWRSWAPCARSTCSRSATFGAGLLHQ